MFKSNWKLEPDKH